MSEQSLVFDSKLLRRGFTKIPNALFEDESLSAGAKLTLGCILSFAWRGDPFPGQERLARMVCCSERTVRGYIAELKKQGYLSVRRRGLGKTNVYTIITGKFETTDAPEADGLFSSRPEESSVQELSSASDKEDEVEEDEVELLAPAPKKNGNKADRDKIWDTLTDLFGAVTTRKKEVERGKVVSELAEAGATPDEIIRRAKTWPNHFDSALMTQHALAKWWDTLGRPPLRRTR
jgi:DNA-binding transcriptional MocR family regulator